jgi:triosephosphate isomerase (TIM)
MRRPIIAGNWKMYKKSSEAVELVRQLRNLVSLVRDVDVVVAPPMTALAAVHRTLEDSRIHLAAQDVHPEAEGAFTGNVSVGMIVDAGCSHVIVGHSERREYHQETDALIHKKAAAALAGGLTPIVCVGERLAEREANRTLEVIRTQVEGVLAGFAPAQIPSLVLAYEPVWAIGTGRTASPAQAQEVHAAIRGIVRERFGAEAADALRIQYGGSVKPDNIDDLMAQPDIDGALVGGASLKAESFARIVKFQKP